ncbi:MAG TPA: response regulator [Alphaproteobacteria bacterium]|jgi:YesN/AraC family two-component response regulator|nr:response regulator [Micavibrio sp.]HQX27227.1 response regulator [Alphaproteobacteria bacterium]
MQIQDLKMVLVDDRSDIRQLLAKIFTNFGMLEENIREAENGAKALELLKQEDAHLVWSDIEMPIMDGLELTKAIRQEEEYSGKYTVIVLNSGKDFHEAAIKADANCFLLKRIDIKLIEDTINTVLMCVKPLTPPPASAHDVPEAHP